MPEHVYPLRRLAARARQAVAHLQTGGSWAISLPDSVRHNLRWFWYDGLFAAVSDNIVITYLSLYLLALGATRAQIGLASSLTSLSAALLLLPGARLVERWGRRKQITIIHGGVISRVMILALSLAPLALSGQAVIYFAIALWITRDAFANLAFPAWMSLTADIVPLEGRGRYFGSRTFVMGVVGIATILLAGELITRIGQPGGYQLALAFAFVVGMGSTYSFAHIRDPHGAAAPERGTPFSLPSLFQHLRAHPGFLTFSAIAFLWNFALNIPGPFFSLYLVENLKATPTMVGITTIASSVSGLLVQRKIGELADRWGPRRVQLISSLFIPFLPIAWAFTRSPWHVVPINIAGGMLWAAYSLASFNFLLILTPPEQRARYSALYQIVVTVSLAIGAATGSWIVTRWGYTAIFICSGIGRMVAALLYSRFVPKSADAVKPTEIST